MNALAAYRGLLTNRPLSLLLGGEFVSAIGEWLYFVAILIVIYQETANPIVLGVFGALRVLPYVVLSIPAGYVADRFDRRLVLLSTDLVRAACMLAMAWLVATDGPVAPLVALAMVAACGSTFFYPTIGAYIPNLVRNERELGPANSLWALLDNLGYIVGPALGGLLVASGGAVFAFLVNAASFAVIAVILVRLPPSSNVAPAREPDQVGKAPRDSDQAADEGTGRIPIRPLVGLLLILGALYTFEGGLGVLTVVIATDVLGAGNVATGYLTAAAGVGGVAGGIASGALLVRTQLARPLLAGGIAAAAGVGFLGVAGTLPAALSAFALFAFGYFLVDVIVTTILQRILPDRQRGRGIGVLMTAGTLGEMTGALLLPVLVGAVGIAILGPASILLVVATVAGIALVGRAATRTPTEAEQTFVRAARGPLFAGVSADRLEVALGRLQTVTVRAGDSIVRQGEPADRFYLVQGGRFRVTQRQAGGRDEELRTLGPDDVFGELGLLNGAPRSATVTATTDGSLLALDGPAFLELVGGGGAIRGRLQSLYASTPNR
jgi:MFS family permease